MATRVRCSAEIQAGNLTELRLPAQLLALRNLADQELPDRELGVAPEALVDVEPIPTLSASRSVHSETGESNE